MTLWKRIAIAGITVGCMLTAMLYVIQKVPIMKLRGALNALSEEGTSKWSLASNYFVVNGREIAPLLAQEIENVNANSRAITIPDAFRIVGSNAQPAIPLLVYYLKVSDSEKANCAIWSLGAIGDSAILTLTNAFSHEDPVVRETVLTFCKAGTEKVLVLLPSVIKALDDPNVRCRLMAVRALGQMPNADERIIAGLMKALDDKEYDIRSLAAYWIGESGRQASNAIPKLQLLLSDDHKEVRNAAQSAIAKIWPKD